MSTAIVRLWRLVISPKCARGKHSECTLFADACQCWCH